MINIEDVIGFLEEWSGDDGGIVTGQMLKDLRTKFEHVDEVGLLVSGLELIRATPKDFVIIKSPQTAREVEAATRAAVAAFQKYCLRNGMAGLSVCLLPAGVEITVLDEQQMKAFGWKRASALELVTSLPSNITGGKPGSH